MSKVNDMLASQRPGTLIEVPPGWPLAQHPDDHRNALGDVIEGKPIYPSADEGATPAPVRTVHSRLARLEGALADLNARHTLLTDRLAERESELAAMRAELGAAEPES